VIDYDRTETRLTIPQLNGVAQDARNARLVIRHAGHFKGGNIDRDTGQVCLSGAVELATFKKPVKWFSPAEGWYTAVQEKYVEPGSYRAEAVYLVMAEIVPTGMCPSCDDDKTAHDALHHVYCGCQPREPWEIVTHYNDQHCPGGTAAQEILDLTAKRAQFLAEEKRRRVNALVAAV
jgi:hypothetical protein